MGKLNYSMRKVQGDKAAQVIVRDVLKFLPSPSKRHIARDPHLEINLEGRLIGDDGFKQICNAIAVILRSGVANLVEFNVSQNELTATGLLYLVPVLAIASGMIRDLDLSRNKVEIVTREDENKWEVFLMAFRKVNGLRHINFSENPLGDRAIEIFSKVYIREKAIGLSKLPREQLGHSDSDSDYGYDSDYDMEAIYKMARKMTISEDGIVSARISTPHANFSIPANVHFKDGKPMTPELRMLHGYPKRHGLRSISYIVFSNTRITDIGAHHISFIVGAHPKPHSLMQFHNGQKAAKLLIDKYKESIYGDCHGIIYRPNELLTQDADRLLAECESMHHSSFKKNNESPSIGRSLSISMKPGYSGRARRDSHSFLELPDNAVSTLATELGRLRMKVQIKILKDCGVSQVHLWKTALRALVVSRAILFVPPKKLVHIPPPPEDKEFEGEIPDEDTSKFSPNSEPTDAVTDYSSEPELGLAEEVKISYAQAVIKNIAPSRVLAPKPKVDIMPILIDKIVQDEPDYIEVMSPIIPAPVLVETTYSPSPSKISASTPTPTRAQQLHRKSTPMTPDDKKQQGSVKLVSTPIDDPPVIIHMIPKVSKSSRRRKGSSTTVESPSKYFEMNCCDKTVTNRALKSTSIKALKSRAPGPENKPSSESIQTPKPKDHHITRGIDESPHLSRMTTQWPVSHPSAAEVSQRFGDIRSTVTKRRGTHSDSIQSERLSSPSPAKASLGCSSPVRASPKLASKIQEEEPPLLGNLPFELWVKIIAFVADPDRLLSGRQLLYLCKWGKSRESLQKELLAIGKLRHQQIWRVLDGAVCTSYE